MNRFRVTFQDGHKVEVTAATADAAKHDAKTARKREFDITDKADIRILCERVEPITLPASGWQQQ